jgi:hypothetical protein
MHHVGSGCLRYCGCLLFHLTVGRGLLLISFHRDLEKAHFLLLPSFIS